MGQVATKFKICLMPGDAWTAALMQTRLRVGDPGACGSRIHQGGAALGGEREGGCPLSGAHPNGAEQPVGLEPPRLSQTAPSCAPTESGVGRESRAQAGGRATDPPAAPPVRPQRSTACSGQARPVLFPHTPTGALGRYFRMTSSSASGRTDSKFLKFFGPGGPAHPRRQAWRQSEDASDGADYACGGKGRTPGEYSRFCCR